MFQISKWGMKRYKKHTSNDYYQVLSNICNTLCKTIASLKTKHTLLSIVHAIITLILFGCTLWNTVVHQVHTWTLTNPGTLRSRDYMRVYRRRERQNTVWGWVDINRLANQNLASEREWLGKSDKHTQTSNDLKPLLESNGFQWKNRELVWQWQHIWDTKVIRRISTLFVQPIVPPLWLKLNSRHWIIFGRPKRGVWGTVGDWTGRSE